MATLEAVGNPPSVGEWGELLAAPRIRARELARADLPDEPGVYLWRHENRAAYVGMATSLRGRAWSKHLGSGLSLSGSSLRRNVCEFLFDIPPNVTGRPLKQKVTAEQAVAIREWLRDCELSWLTCISVQDADQLERRLRLEYLPPLNRV